ncbi:MAG: 6-phosphofructokinase [Candidatus Eremiobacter antarcticus]|nr:6-phosphofructokinase [Candidatus Eremiobacteraeota bacterium]MBC5808680.1 6-phosphofructokinase [Candidatus Eremiobacteraeota bacterium]PZR62165.1 MAG: 6-phosphofructokinase [Candidatus Eremiobacter sp. RRmetagenome_bin22]
MSPTLGILVGGGPAPGINGVIASATIEAINEGCRVKGIYDGYHWLAQGDATHAADLSIEEVSRIHWLGGSILRTSRANPARDATTLANSVSALRTLGVTHLLCIGGDDTTFGAAKIAEAAGGGLQVATVPKTIDNDLPLPDNMPTFGFETARAVGTNIVESLMEDARTTTRWYVVVSMGRKSGALALGICKAAGATLAIIPEEFGQERVPLQLVRDTIIGSMIKRRVSGHDHGVAIVAEGLIERLQAADSQPLQSAARDAYGNARLSEVDLADLLSNSVSASLQEMGLPVTVVGKEIGYELRCAKPLAFDVEYTRTLGYGAVRYLLSGGSGAMVSLRGGKVTPVTLQEMLDPQTARIRVRMVDTKTEAYEVGRKYMIRLELDDFTEPKLTALATAAGMKAQAFAERFSAMSIAR